MSTPDESCLAGQLPDLQGNIFPLTVFCVILVVVAFVYSLASRAIERALHKTHPHLLKALYRFYQELTVAALVSFMFLIMQHTCYDVSLATHLSPHSVTTVRGTFHWFHLWVYAMFIFYGVNVGLQITWCVYRGRVWRNAEETSASESRRNYEDMLVTARRLGLWSWVNFVFRIQLFNASALMRYHFLRIRYIQKHGLSERFSFAAFLSQRLERECATAMRTHWLMWVTILGMILINLGRYALTPLDTVEDGRVFVQASFMVLGWVMFLGGAAVHIAFATMLLRTTDPETTYGLSAAPPLTASLLAAQREPSSSDVAFLDRSAEEEKRKKEQKRCFRSITPLGLSKWCFQYIIFCQSFFLAALTMYAVFYAADWGWGVLAGLPSVLLVLIPLPQVLPLYTLLTVIDHGPRSGTTDIQMSEILSPHREPGGSQRFSTLMLVSPSVYEAPSFSSSLAPATPTPGGRSGY